MLKLILHEISPSHKQLHAADDIFRCIFFVAGKWLAFAYMQNDSSFLNPLPAIHDKY